MKTTGHASVFTALFAALICAGAFITIPVGPVPIVLQNAFAILAGLLLGPLQGAGAVGLFLVAGALGLPVFSGGRGGFAVIAGPTGGYLAGYFIGAFVAGQAARRAPRTKSAGNLPILISATLAGFAAIYIPGVLVLHRNLLVKFPDITIAETITKGFLPFVLPDLIKAAVLVPIAWKLRPIIARFLPADA